MIQVEMLIILDGFGYRKEKDGNAIANANMKTWKMLQKKYPHTLLRASGSAVGLPDGFMGNSEVGHTCIGAGRVVRTSFCKLHDSIDDKTFFKNKLLIEKFKILKEKNKSLHLMGLLSDSGVHAHIDHLFALIRLAKQEGLKKVFIHAFLDGRDTPPKSAKKYLQLLQSVCEKEKCGKIGSVHGRFYAMDRDENWDRIKKSYDVLCGKTESKNGVRSWSDVIEDNYKKNITDEFIEPTLLIKDGIVSKDDGIVFYNFRPDRAWQITKSFLENNKLSFFISTTRYKKEFEKFNNDVLFERMEIKNTLLDVIAKKKPVFTIAETEKYAHVTYFFRGKVEKKLSNETRVLVPSKKVKSYVDHPEMSAPEITKKIIESLKTKKSCFYLVNFANCDMVGHSGDFDATVKACQCLDEQLAILYKEVVEKLGGTIFLTGDHGNAEENKTSHTTNPVPFIVINKSLEGEHRLFENQDFSVRYGVSQVAPTILKYIGLEIPEEMEKESIDFLM